MSNPTGIEIFDWQGEGYQPLLFSHDWQVARLNWEPLLASDRLGEIERHVQTDEVFVLLAGRALLFVVDPTGAFQAVMMQSGVTYNVTRGSWHNLVANRDASIIIVENRNTHITDTEIRQMTADEIVLVRQHLTGWGED
jgi:hypothetical protein